MASRHAVLTGNFYPRSLQSGRFNANKIGFSELDDVERALKTARNFFKLKFAVMLNSR